MLTDPGIPAAVTTAVVLLLVGGVGSLLAAARARRLRKAERLLWRDAWRRDWLVGDPVFGPDDLRDRARSRIVSSRDVLADPAFRLDARRYVEGAV